MKVLETILNFLVTLAQIIFPRKQNPAPGNSPCPSPLPLPPVPPLPVERGDGSAPGMHRGDSVAHPILIGGTSLTIL